MVKDSRKWWSVSGWVRPALWLISSVVLGTYRVAPLRLASSRRGIVRCRHKDTASSSHTWHQDSRQRQPKAWFTSGSRTALSQLQGVGGTARSCRRGDRLVTTVVITDLYHFYTNFESFSLLDQNSYYGLHVYAYKEANLKTTVVTNNQQA